MGRLKLKHKSFLIRQEDDGTEVIVNVRKKLLGKKYFNYKGRLTSAQLAECFPDYKRKIFKRYRELESDLLFINKLEYKVDHSPALQDGTEESEFWKMFYKKSILTLLGQRWIEKQEYMDILQKTIKIMRRKNGKLDNSNVDKLNFNNKILNAKSVLIKDLYEGNLRRTTHGFYGICPFHYEKTASFHIYVKTNTYYCFGCQSSGDSISYMMKIRGLDFVNAIKQLNTGGYHGV